MAPRTHLDAKQLLIVATVILNVLGQSPEISIEGGGPVIFTYRITVRNLLAKPGWWESKL